MLPFLNQFRRIGRAACVRCCCTLLAFTLLLSPGFAAASATEGAPAGNATRYVYPIGKTVGIKLFSDGVLVIGLSDVKTRGGDASPAKDCGLHEGDIITHMNQQEVNTIEEVQTILQDAGTREISMNVLRGEKTAQVTTQAVQCSADGAYKLGAWIRDSMAGIGTMTFYDPGTGIFGTLGHGINDVDTSQLMPLQSGAIMPSTVADVKKGEAGTPGQLQGAFELERDLGTLYANTEGGVFGRLTDASFADGYKRLPVASSDEIKTGEATICCNISDGEVEEFTVEIVKVFSGACDTRDLMLKITDQRLLTATGGIVQGMSGSPIIQNGKFIGAVTHVLVNDPTHGYGIAAENMLTLANTAAAEL